MTLTWKPHPKTDNVEILVDEKNECHAMLEDFGYRCYPTAINCRTNNLERGGGRQDRVEAKLWCERMVGMHPLKETDQGSPFYYKPLCEAGFVGVGGQYGDKLIVAWEVYKVKIMSCARCGETWAIGDHVLNWRPSKCLDRNKPT